MTEHNELNLYQKLAKIRKQVEVMKKNKSGFNYKYVTDEEILAKVTAFMNKYDISLIPEIISGSIEHEQYHYVKTKINKSTKEPYEEHNNEIIVRVDMTYTWVNNLNPDERITVPWVAIGQQSDASQALGSGLTYLMRYFLLKYFNVATPEDDVDNWRSKQRAAELAEEKIIAREIIEQLDVLVSDYLTKYPEKKDQVKEFMSKYVKDGNYFSVKEPKVASRILTDFKYMSVEGGR